MPRYNIIHETTYHFSSEVFFEPHILRFKPKNTPHNKLEQYDSTISPTAAGVSEQLDIDGNFIQFCWFEGLHERLEIKAASILEITDYNPFNFIVYPKDYNKFPFVYSKRQIDLLSSTLKRPKLSRSLINYVEHIKELSDGSTIPFIVRLTQQIYNDFKLETREQGKPLAPEKTFELQKGSCRDLTWLQIQLLRFCGIASRFTSGYFYLESDEPEFELHAWLEAFIPGAGWIGFDPSHGIAAGSSHITVANSAYIENTMPVAGSVRGDGTSELNTNLFIEKLI